MSIAAGLDTIGDNAGGLLSNLNMFSNQLPGVKFVQLRIHNNGNVDISPAGLVLPGQIETMVNANEIEQPFYVYGHLHSKEFHRKGKECPFLEKMKEGNTILFLTPVRALSMGYKGCRFCYPEYDTGTDARILLYFRELQPISGSLKREVSLSFELMQAITLNNQQVKPQFDLDQSYDGYFNGGIFYFSDQGLPDFLPGFLAKSVDSAAISPASPTS